ncbi:MAG: FAD-dependent oxidoreductase [Thermoguttaceae bacterium]|nr:FAD-dependent oxidoreductase [Thermoguttaceae bacterium]
MRTSFLAMLATTLLLASSGVVSAQVLRQNDKTVFIEAESFADKGGWGIDTQSVDLVGSPYLIAHGWGNPVADAKTNVTFPGAGEYRVFARTRNWVAPWTPEYAPGKFQIALNGKKLATEFGTNGVDWAWQDGGTVTIAANQLDAEISLCDLTGFDGRVDAIVFTADKDFTPGNDLDALASMHKDALRLPDEIPVAGNGKVYDLVVVGGGIAGNCAAIAAARLGASVAFINDRPVLGGNGSTEVRVHLNGEINLPPYPNLGNLTHLMGPHGGGNAGDPGLYKDNQRLELVQNEKNIDLYLGVRVDRADVEKANDSIRITSVCGSNIETGQQLRFLGKTFADCTGDAVVGYLAGADFHMGREAKAEYDEPSAPEQGDKMTMGSSVQWNTAETDAPTTFPELPWAIQFNEQTIRPSIHGDWDWEGGMNRDQCFEMERIRDVGLRAAYGHWSYMKNHTPKGWEDKVKNRKLNWTAFVAGKRESRRLLGDVVLREQDVVEGRPFDDASVVTTWSIDLHYPEPSNLKYFPQEQFRAICEQVQIKPYAIPYRCFYSRNVDNLFMAGRDISVTHIALGTIRVMRTGGMMGEVVGMAASVCAKNDCLPRDVYQSRLDDLKKLMEEGVAPPTPKANSLIRPKWLTDDAVNVAPKAKIAVDSEYQKGPKYPKENINDGKFDISGNEGRWVSDVDGGHWVDITFDEPVTINAMRVISGQAGGKTPIGDFSLMREENGKLVDIPGTVVTENEAVIVGLKFEEATSKRFRLMITQSPGYLARLYEVEFYKVD